MSTNEDDGPGGEPESGDRNAASGIETKYAFTGDTGWIIVGILCCPPFGLYYYLDNREQVAVCPECRETIPVNASTCSQCSADLDEYQ